MVDEVEEKSAIDNDDVLSRFGKALQFGLDQPLERIADTFKSFGFNDTEKFLRDLTEQPENYVSAAEKFMQNNGMGYSWEYLPRAVVEQIGSLAGNIATRAAGAGIGGAVAGPAGAFAGALTAPALFEALQILGPTVYERARNEGREEPTLEDWLAAAPTTAISGFLGSYGAQNIARLNNITKKTALNNITRGALEEGATETLQSAVEQTGTTAFTKSGFKLDQREAFGEGIIGAGTGGGTNAVFEAGGKGVNKFLNFSPSDSYLTVDEPKKPDADFKDIEFINGQPKFDELKRKTNTFRGSGLDVDVSRTGPETAIDYLNRLAKQALLIDLGNFSRNDITLKTKTQLGYELGIIKNVVPFENPLNNLSPEQSNQLEEAYEEYLENNKLQQLLNGIEDLTYLPEGQRQEIIDSVRNAAEEAKDTAVLYSNMEINDALPTGRAAPEQVLETGTIDYLATLAPIKFEGNLLEGTTRSNLVQAFLADNPNLTEIEKAFILAKQTWGQDLSYTGLEQDLNLTYHEDKSGQAYQRTPAEQAVVINALNDFYRKNFETPSNIPFNVMDTNSLFENATDSEGKSTQKSRSVESFYKDLAQKHTDKMIKDGTAAQMFMKIYNTFPKSFNTYEKTKDRETLMDELNEYFDEAFEVLGKNNNGDIAYHAKEFPTFGLDEDIYDTDEKILTEIVDNFKVLEGLTQNDIAQLLVDMSNPIYEEGFVRDLFRSFPQVLDPSLPRNRFFDSPEFTKKVRFFGRFAEPMLDESYSGFKKKGEYLTNMRSLIQKAYDNYVTDPNLRARTEERIAMNSLKAGLMLTRRKSQEDFNTAFVDSHISPEQTLEIVTDTIKDTVDSTVEEISRANPEQGAALNERAQNILEDSNEMETLSSEIRNQLAEYIQAHQAEYRSAPDDPVNTNPAATFERTQRKIMQDIKNRAIGGEAFQERFGFLSGAIKKLAMKQKYETNNIIVGRDIDKPDFWAFLEKSNPTLFKLVDRLNLEQYGDVAAEIVIDEANNTPFATPINPVFMSSYFINENIQKLISGRPYDAKELMQFLITPHKQEKPIYPTNTEAQETPVLDRDGQPILDEQGQPRTKKQRNLEDKSKSAKELFGSGDSRIAVNEEFINEARKEMIDTNIGNFLIQRHADNRPVTKEELEILLMDDANRTLMTVSRKSMIDEYLENGTYTVAYEDVSVDPELYNLATDHLTLHLFNDYKKSKRENERQIDAGQSGEQAARDTVDKINQPYGDKNEYGEANHQYQDRGHPYGRFWARLLEITGEEAIDNLRLTSLLSDVVAPYETESVEGIHVLNESQNDSEYFRDENVNRITDATFPLKLKELKDKIIKVYPDLDEQDLNNLVERIEDSRAGVKSEESVADLGYELESFVNDYFNKKRGFDFGPKSPSIAYKSFLDFLSEMRGIGATDDNSRQVAQNATSEFIQEIDLPVQYNKDFTNSVIGDNDLNNRPEIIDPVGGPPLRAGVKDGRNVVNLRGRQLQSGTSGATYTMTGLGGRGGKPMELSLLFDLYGAAQHVSENNLTGLGQVIPGVIAYDIKDNSAKGSEIDMGKQQNVENWLVNSFFHSPLQAYKPFIFHALLLDRAESGDTTFFNQYISGSVAGEGGRGLQRKIQEIFSNKDSSAYKFLKSVLPSENLNRNNPAEVSAEAKRIWRNWKKSVKDMQDNYTPAVPFLGALKDVSIYKQLAEGIEQFDAQEDLKYELRDFKEVVDRNETLYETPYVGIGQNPLDKAPFRESLGQTYTKKTVRMMMKNAIENSPDITHILIPSRFVNQLYGQDQGAHENFDKALAEILKISEQEFEANVIPVTYGNMFQSTKDTFKKNLETAKSDNVKEDGRELIASTFAQTVNSDSARKKVTKSLAERFKDPVEYAIARTLATGDNAKIGYLLNLEPFKVRDDTKPSGFGMKIVFRGHRLGGLVGKGIVGLRDEIYNSPLSKYVT